MEKEREKVIIRFLYFSFLFLTVKEKITSKHSGHTVSLLFCWLPVKYDTLICWVPVNYHSHNNSDNKISYIFVNH